MRRDTEAAEGRHKSFVHPEYRFIGNNGIFKS